MITKALEAGELHNNDISEALQPCLSDEESDAEDLWLMDEESDEDDEEEEEEEEIRSSYQPSIECSDDDNALSSYAGESGTDEPLCPRATPSLPGGPMQLHGFKAMRANIGQFQGERTYWGNPKWTVMVKKKVIGKLHMLVEEEN